MNNKIRTVTGCILVFTVFFISAHTQNVFLLLASVPLLIGGYPWHKGDRLWTNHEDIAAGAAGSICAIIAACILKSVLSGVLGLALLVLYGWRLKGT